MPLPEPGGRPAAATLAAALADPALVVDAGGRVLAWNDAAVARLRITGGARGRILGEVVSAADVAAAVRLPVAAGADPGAHAGAPRAILVWQAAPDVRQEDVAIQKARTLARLAPGVSHELVNRLGAVRAFGSMLGLDDHVTREYGAATIAAVGESGERALALAQSLVDLARRGGARRPIRLATAVDAAVRLVEFELLSGVTIECDIPDDLADVEADPAGLHQALAALLVNALDALGHPGAGGRLEVAAREVAGIAPAAVELRLTDSAPLVPEDDASHLFDIRPPSGCSPRAGLDLAVARRLVEADGGSLRYEQTPDGTNAMVLALPVVRPWTPDTPAEPVRPSRSIGQAATVLACDDEELVRDLLVRLLERAGFRVLPAASGPDALALLDREAVDVVIADNLMAAMSGPELHTAVTERHPDLAARFVLMSGDPEDTDLVSFARATGIRVLPKPFDAAVLTAVVREVAGA